jgi:hypothetical protein
LWVIVLQSERCAYSPAQSRCSNRLHSIFCLAQLYNRSLVSPSHSYKALTFDVAWISCCLERKCLSCFKSIILEEYICTLALMSSTGRKTIRLCYINGPSGIAKCSMLKPGTCNTPDTMSYKNAYTDRYHSTTQLQHNVNSPQINSSRKHAFLIVPPRNTCSLAH